MKKEVESMKIVVCMKQVPASSKVDIDPETGAMKRMSGETRTNPYDLFALETALQIREKVGGTVTVLTMGPSQAEEMMRDAYTMGADDAVILSDRKFAGADVLATSYALAQGIQVIGGADLIICGRQTTDGDTAQVGPAIAEHLTIPHAAWVAEIVDVNEKAIQVRQDLVGDLIQEGNMSLLLALAEEIPEEGKADWMEERLLAGMESWVKEQTEQKYRDESMVEKVRKLEAAIRELSDDEEQKFSVEELAAYLDMDEEEIRAVLRLTSEGADEEK